MPETVLGSLEILNCLIVLAMLWGRYLYSTHVKKEAQSHLARKWLTQGLKEGWGLITTHFIVPLWSPEGTPSLLKNKQTNDPLPQTHTQEKKNIKENQNYVIWPLLIFWCLCSIPCMCMCRGCVCVWCLVGLLPLIFINIL